MNRTDLRVTFTFLKRAAFYDQDLPKGITFSVKPLAKVWGYYYDTKQIEIDAGIRRGTTLLKVMAHEMIHAVQHQSGSFDKSDHGPKFQLLAKLICKRMGWRDL